MNNVYNPYGFQLHLLPRSMKKFHEKVTQSELLTYIYELNYFSSVDRIEVVAWQWGWDSTDFIDGKITFIFYCIVISRDAVQWLPQPVFVCAYKERDDLINFQTDAFVVLNETLYDKSFYFTDMEIVYCGYIVTIFSAN